MLLPRHLCALASVLLVLGLTAAFAPVPHPFLPKGRYGNDFASMYSASQSDDNVVLGTGKVCQLCHQSDSGGDGWNGYGWSLRALITQGQSSTSAMAMIEGVNSASPNGETNLREIQAGTQPGWTDGPSNTIYFKDGTTLTNQMPPAGILGSLDPPCLLADRAILVRRLGNAGTRGGHAPRFDGCGELDPHNAGVGEVVLRQAPAHAPAFFLGAFPPVDQVESPWGTLVARPAMVTPFITDAMGEVRLRLPADLGPATLLAQWAVLDPDAAGRITLSNALQMEWR